MVNHRGSTAWRIILAVAAVLAPPCLEALAQSDVKASYRRPDTIPFPAANPYTPEKAALGKMLYFDPRLSGGQNLNCASCHNPSFGWEMPLPLAIGSQNTELGRHAPTILNQAWGQMHFWDGRAPSLEEQAKGPIEAAVEMNMPLPRLADRLGKIPDYQRLFKQVFPKNGLTGDTIVQALATYERTIVSTYAPFDAWIDGDEQAIPEAAKRGFAVFNGKGRCSACHTGWNMTDNKFHDIGLPSTDVGRFAVDGADEHNRHAFKTPGLRDLTRRAPYMHDGSLTTLEDVVMHYVVGGIERPSRSPDVMPLDLDEIEVRDLVAFLESLTGDLLAVPLPALPY